MAESLADRFIGALERLEREGDVEGLVRLFGDECELSNSAMHRKFEGRDGVRLFWREYRGAFGDVRSSFKSVIEGGGRAALEWHTEGTSPDGTSISYDGVSILEEDGGGIRRFFAYFDPRHLGRQLYHAPA